MSTQMSLCYSSRYLQQQLKITNEDIRATAAALLDAVRQLEFDSDAQTIQQTNQENGWKPMRKFFIKRNYSGVVWQDFMHFCSMRALQVKMTRSVHMTRCELVRCKAIVATSGYAICYTKQGQCTDCCCASIKMHSRAACEACTTNSMLCHVQRAP